MNLGELKQTLAAFDPDMDSSEVFMVTAPDKKRQFDLLAGVGYIQVDDTAHIALVSAEEVKRQGLA